MILKNKAYNRTDLDLDNILVCKAFNEKVKGNMKDRFRYF